MWVINNNATANHINTEQGNKNEPNAHLQLYSPWFQALLRVINMVCMATVAVIVAITHTKIIITILKFS